MLMAPSSQWLFLVRKDSARCLFLFKFSPKPMRGEANIVPIVQMAKLRLRLREAKS